MRTIHQIAIRTSVALLVCGMASLVAKAQYAITWSTVDAGGTMSAAGGAYGAGGTAGQPDAITQASGGTYTLTGGFWAVAMDRARLKGDMNCDGVVNNFDIDPFVMALTSPAAYTAAFPSCNLMNADINDDGNVNNFDIDAFVNCLTHGGCS